jgi:hypothetical protein
MKYTNDQWQTIGNFSYSQYFMIDPSLAIDNNGFPYIVYTDNTFAGMGGVSVMKYNGNGWGYLGKQGFSNYGFTSHYCSDKSLTIDKNNVPYVVFSDPGVYNHATVMKFDGGVWITIGYDMSLTPAISPQIHVDSNCVPYVVDFSFYDTNNFQVKMYDGIKWQSVGYVDYSSYYQGYGNTYVVFSIDPSGIPYLFFSDSANSGKATVISYR